MIYVLTYDAPHRKTYDICNLLISHDKMFEVLALPFHYVKTHEPLIKHRPEPYCLIPPSVLYEDRYHKLELIDEIHISVQEGDTILIGGAGILPEWLTKSCIVLNSHPGLVEYTRGLDALKWAIWGGYPIGVTVHRATQEADWGDVYSEVGLSVERNDTFHGFAQRLYELEICELVKAVVKPPHHTRTLLKYPPVINKRMPHALEMDLLKKFEERRMKA